MQVPAVVLTARMHPVETSETTLALLITQRTRFRTVQRPGCLRQSMAPGAAFKEVRNKIIVRESSA
jgi:hypothetical protein